MTHSERTDSYDSLLKKVAVEMRILEISQLNFIINSVQLVGWIRLHTGCRQL